MIHDILSLLNEFYIPKITILDIVEILIIATIVYYVLKYVKNTRMWIVSKGLFLLGIFYCIAYILSFDAILVIFQSLTLIISIAIVVIFQPEIRKCLENIGSKKYQFIPRRKKKTQIKQKITDNSIEQLVSACYALSKEKTGALIVIENSIPLNDLVDTGIKLNAEISSQLLINIFEKNTPLHDGAVIIQDETISSATCYLPLSENQTINKKLGTRHRAAIGATEVTDALVIIVSEETGAVSIARHGKIKHNMKEEKFAAELKKFQEETEEMQQTNIKEGLLRNNKTKVFSLILSFIIWIALINVSNPIVSKTFFDVPIIIQNESAITSIEKTYSIKSEETAIVVVKGNRADIDKLSKDKIMVYADFEKLSDVYAVPLKAVVPSIPNAETYIVNDVMTIVLEDMVETEFKIEINQEGTPNKGCYVHSIEPDTLNVSIKTGASTMQIIDKVCINVNVDNLKADRTFSVSPIVYDRNGNVINPEKFVLNIEKITGSIKTYKVKEVPLNITLEAQDILTQSIMSTHYCDIDTVSIAAPDEILETIDEVQIFVPFVANETQALNDVFIKNIKISDYFKNEDVFLVDENLSANISIELGNNAKKAFTIYTNIIELRGKNELLSYSFEQEMVEIIIAGIKEDVLMLDTSKLTYYVDVTDLGIGTHQVHILLVTNETISMHDIEITISVKSALNEEGDRNV